MITRYFPFSAYGLGLGLPVSAPHCRCRCRCRVDQFRSRVGADSAPGPPPFCRVDPFRRERIGLEVSVEASAPAAFGGIIPVPSRGPLSPASGMSGDARAPASRRGRAGRASGGISFPSRTLRPGSSGRLVRCSSSQRRFSMCRSGPSNPAQARVVGRPAWHLPAFLSVKARCCRTGGPWNRLGRSIHAP
jgi:hypothetical protein